MRRLERIEPSALRAALGALIATLVVLLFLVPAATAQESDADDGYDAASAPSVIDGGKAVLGKHLFRSFCASCHGAEAKGDGSIADMLRVPPANLTVLAAENGGEFPYQRAMAVIDGREKIKGHGTSDMPAWGDAFAEISDSDEQVQEKISQLVHFIWSIQEAGE